MDDLDGGTRTLSSGCTWIMVGGLLLVLAPMFLNRKRQEELILIAMAVGIIIGIMGAIKVFRGVTSG